MMIKSETRYKGYRFRSRLAARWAVFFEALKIEWEYELQGFLFSGKSYLPSFYLPSHNTWVEVSGLWPDDAYIAKLLAFQEHNGQAVVLACGMPMENYAKLFCWDTNDSGGGLMPDGVDVLPIAYQYKADHAFGWAVKGGLQSGRTLFATAFFDAAIWTDEDGQRCEETIEDAVSACQKARFAHGECE